MSAVSFPLTLQPVVIGLKRQSHFVEAALVQATGDLYPEMLSPSSSTAEVRQLFPALLSPRSLCRTSSGAAALSPLQASLQHSHLHSFSVVLQSFVIVTLLSSFWVPSLGNLTHVLDFRSCDSQLFLFTLHLFLKLQIFISVY